MRNISAMYDYHLSRWGRDVVVLSPAEYVSYIETCGELLWGDEIWESLYGEKPEPYTWKDEDLFFRDTLPEPEPPDMELEAIAEYMTWASELLKLKGAHWEGFKGGDDLSVTFPDYDLKRIMTHPWKLDQPMLSLRPQWHKSPYKSECKTTQTVRDLYYLLAQYCYLGSMLELGSVVDTSGYLWNTVRPFDLRFSFDDLFEVGEPRERVEKRGPKFYGKIRLRHVGRAGVGTRLKAYEFLVELRTTGWLSGKSHNFQVPLTLPYYETEDLLGSISNGVTAIIAQAEKFMRRHYFDVRLSKEILGDVSF